MMDWSTFWVFLLLARPFLLVIVALAFAQSIKRRK